MRKTVAPVVFRCSLPENGASWEGRVEVARQEGAMAELIIYGRGSRMDVVVGKYISGQYICIPDIDAGCPLSCLGDVFWNRERLSGRIGEVDASTVAYALKAVREKLEGNWL